MNAEELREYLEKNPEMVVLVDVLDRVLKKAEKAHPALPDNAFDLITSGLGRKRDWWGLYYMDEDELWEVFNERIQAWKEYYDALWKAYEKLNCDLIEPPELTPELIEGNKSWMYLSYMPTSSREFFKEMKEKIADCEDLKCILQRLEDPKGVSNHEN